MLRITVSNCEDHPMYVLEGRLAGDWVEELVWVTRQLGPRTNPVIDIEHVHYVDPLGEKALHWLNRLGAGFVARNPYVVDLCDRLELRRLNAAESKTRPPNNNSSAGALSAPVRGSRRRSSREKSRR